jgi:ribosomal protein S18 acetylase RimI-like enzyme
MFQSSTHSDLSKIAICHQSAFPKSFSSQLGNHYVSKMLSWYLESGKSFLFHMEENGIVIGYCGAIINDGTLSTGSASAMTQHAFNDAVKAMIFRPWLLFHPEVTKRYFFLWINLKTKIGIHKPKRSADVKQQLQKEPHVGLVVIGVASSFHGKGYGSKILQEFERRALTYKINKFQLSVKASNNKAILAYNRNGWKEGDQINGSLSMYKHI